MVFNPNHLQFGKSSITALPKNPFLHPISSTEHPSPSSKCLKVFEQPRANDLADSRTLHNHLSDRRRSSDHLIPTTSLPVIDREGIELLTELEVDRLKYPGSNNA